jgi:hypothetical protein
VIYGIWRFDQRGREAVSEKDHKNFATDLCTPTQNPKPLKNSGTPLQTIIHECNELLVVQTQVRPRICMLHTIAGNFFKKFIILVARKTGMLQLFTPSSHLDLTTCPNVYGRVSIR